jgi:hypothetical protein
MATAPCLSLGFVLDSIRGLVDVAAHAADRIIASGKADADNSRDEKREEQRNSCSHGRDSVLQRRVAVGGRAAPALIPLLCGKKDNFPLLTSFILGFQWRARLLLPT